MDRDMGIPKARDLFRLKRLENKHVVANKKGEVVKTGATIIAFKFKDGVLVAADRRVTWGYSILTDDYEDKIRKVGRFTAAGGAGVASHAQLLFSELESLNSTFAVRSGNIPLTIEGQAKFLADVLYEADLLGMLSVEMIICGLNFDRTFEIYQIESEGFMRELSFAVIGSGTNGALKILEDYEGDFKKASIGLLAAVQVAIKAIHEAAKKDAGSSPVPMVPPIIATITEKDGFEYVSDKIIEKIRRQVVGKKR